MTENAFVELSRLNFTNRLHAAFESIDPKSTKRHWWLEYIFVLLGSAHLKAACNHVSKIEKQGRSKGRAAGAGALSGKYKRAQIWWL